jgi:hypothetical protein
VQSTIERLRTTVQVAREEGLRRDLLGFIEQFGLVSGTRRVGKAILWPDESVEQARQLIARYPADERRRGPAA